VPETNPQITPERIKELIAESFPGDMAIEPLEISEERATGRIVVDDRHLHPGKFVHGGVWTALADSVAAWATFRNIPPGWDFTTIELKLNVFSAGRLGDEIVAEAIPLHVGRSTAVIEVRMHRGEKLVANFVVTQFLLPA
jgi:1,4-dihydroxy-2-naphthoyl-CoA hydrolase